MCGRLDQNDINRLIQNFAWADDLFNRSSALGQFNVAPGTYRPVLHADQDALFVDDLHWGYRSAWAEASGKLPMAINTRLEKITNRYWKPLLQKGRAIVPAAGWYEWTGEKGSKQPWHIHRQDGAPLYLAALASIRARGRDQDPARVYHHHRRRRRRAARRARPAPAGPLSRGCRPLARSRPAA